MARKSLWQVIKIVSASIPMLSSGWVGTAMAEQPLNLNGNIYEIQYQTSQGQTLPDCLSFSTNQIATIFIGTLSYAPKNLGRSENQLLAVENLPALFNVALDAQVSSEKERENENIAGDVIAIAPSNPPIVTAHFTGHKVNKCTASSSSSSMMSR